MDANGSVKSTAFADALARARQLAAKLGAGNPNAGSGSSGAAPPPAAAPMMGFKRGPDDYHPSEPDSKRGAAMADPFGAQLAAMRGGGGGFGAATANGLGIKTGIGISGSGKACQEEIRIPDPLVGLIIGRGGEQINRIQTEASCKVQLAPDDGSGKDRSCYLQGSKEAIERAKEMVMEIVSSKSHEIGSTGRGFPNKVPSAGASQGQVEMMIPGTKVGLVIGKGGETIRNLQDKSGTKMFILQDNMFEERDKPLRIVGEPDLVEHARQLVLELINESPSKSDFVKGKSEYGSGDVGGGRMGGSFGGVGLETMKFPVPKVSVGLIIGKGGEMIKRIQVETGAKVQFDPVNSDMGDMDEQLAIITGKSDQIRLAQLKIEELVETALYGGKGGGEGGAPRGGGPRGGWEGGGGGFKRGDGEEDRMVVPVTRVGMIIGKGGETIRMINQTSGAHCEIDRNLAQDGPERTFVIRGTRQQIQHAKELITEKVNTFPPKGRQDGQGPPGRGEYGSSQQSWGGGGGGGSYGGAGGSDWNQSDPSKMQDASAAQWAAYYAAYYSAPAAASGGGSQPDYTEQWIEYLRAQGQHEQADLLEQQAKAGKTGASEQSAGTGGVPAAAAAGGANGSNVDYSQQWAEHYRSIGKIQEAESIEAYIKAQKSGAGGPPQNQNQHPPEPNKQQPSQQPPYQNYNYGAGGSGGYYPPFGNGGGAHQKPTLTPPGDS